MNSKHSSRIAAVQVMYQCDITKENIQDVLFNFKKYYLKNEKIHKKINKSFFNKLISHFSKDVNYKEIIESSLLSKVNFSSLETILVCILKVAILEIKFERTDMPVIINEYVEIAKYFLDEKSIPFINVILDKILKNIHRECTNE